MDSSAELKKALSRISQLEEKVKLLEDEVEFLEIYKESSNTWETYRDKDGKVFYISPSFETITGYNRIDFIGHRDKLNDLVYPEDLSEVRNQLKLQAEKKESKGVEIRVIDKAGNLKYFTASSRPVFDRDGNFTGTRTSLIDNTEIKKIQMELTESEFKFRSIFNNTNQGIVLVDENGKIIEWNRRLTDITGLTEEDVLGRYSWDVAFSRLSDRLKKETTPEKFKDLWQKNFQSINVNDAIRDSGFILNQQGEEEYVEDFIKLLIVGDKKFFCSFQDYLTYQKKIEQSLKEEKEKFEKIFRFSPLPMALLNAKDIVYKDVNKAFEDMTGYEKENIIGHRAGEFSQVNSDDTSTMLGLLQEGKDIQQFNLTIIKKSGKRMETLTSVTRLNFESKEHYIAMFSDITDLKNSEYNLNLKLEELNQLNRELELYTYTNNDLKQFAYTASHQLQEPIRTITNYMNIIEEDYSHILDKNALNYIYLVKYAAERMSMLINTLLEYSKIGRKNKLEYADCGQIINDAIQELNYKIEESNAVINVGPMPVLHLFETEFRKLVNNLLGNALKFRRKGVAPEISVTSEKNEVEYVFTIEDNGIGIPMVHKDKIFELFQRLHYNEAEYEGKGVGLALCKKIVNMHNGVIWVEARPEFGSRFRFTIPVI